MASVTTAAFRKCRLGFTLVELVTVITIIVILGSLVAASILSIQRKAKRAQSEAVFGKLIFSITQYRKDHAAYPDFGGSLKGGDVVTCLKKANQWSRFAEIMALSQPDGIVFENPKNQSLVNQYNPKLKRYYDLQLGELQTMDGADRLVDGFGNPNFMLYWTQILTEKLMKHVCPNLNPELYGNVLSFTLPTKTGMISRN